MEQNRFCVWQRELSELNVLALAARGNINRFKYIKHFIMFETVIINGIYGF
jgi:hypothetical protein